MLHWFRQIDDARTPADVIALARDYFASWTPEELARLPQPVRPGRMKTERDLEELHSLLVEEYTRSEAQGDALTALQRMTSFVVRASVRMAQLHEGDEPSQGPSSSGGEDQPPRKAAPNSRS